MSIFRSFRVTISRGHVAQCNLAETPNPYNSFEARGADWGARRCAAAGTKN